MRHAYLVAAALVLAPTLALAEEDGLKAIRLEIASLQIDHALNLTRDQARALLPVLREGAARVQDMKQAHERSKPALLAALTRARDELKSTGSISDASQLAIRTARGDEQFKQIHQQTRALKERALQILTPQQKEALKGVQLGVGPEMGMGMEMAEHAATGGFGGGPEAGPGQAHHGGFLKHGIIAHVVVSEPFIALVEARAR